MYARSVLPRNQIYLTCIKNQEKIKALLNDVEVVKLEGQIRSTCAA